MIKYKENIIIKNGKNKNIITDHFKYEKTLKGQPGVVLDIRMLSLRARYKLKVRYLKIR